MPKEQLEDPHAAPKREFLRRLLTDNFELVNLEGFSTLQAGSNWMGDLAKVDFEAEAKRKTNLAQGLGEAGLSDPATSSL